MLYCYMCVRVISRHEDGPKQLPMDTTTACMETYNNKIYLQINIDHCYNLSSHTAVGDRADISAVKDLRLLLRRQLAKPQATK